MDPIEQKTTHSYPNADRAIGDNNFSNEEKPRPLIHISDVISPETKTEDVSYKTSTVHTFKDDMAGEASKGNFSIGKIMVANSKKAHETSTNVIIGTPSKNLLVKILLPLICILIIAGFSYIGFKSAKTPSEINASKNPTQQIAGGILYTEQSTGINIKGRSISNLYKEIQNGTSSGSLSSGKLRSVVLNYQEGTSTIQLSSVDFLSIIAPSAPSVLLRNLKNEYVFGYYFYDSEEPFLILRSANYDSTFAGMLEWERNMYADLGSLIFRKESLTTNYESNTTTSSTSTNTSVKSEFETPFVDKIISNNDARVLYRPNGNIAFFYTFFNKDTIIIATSEQSLREIIYRLTTGKITR